MKAGALLVREWNGKLERVMILEEGFAWNGQTFGSLSQIAKTMTGTGGVKVTEARRYAGRPPSRERRSMPRERATRPEQRSVSACRLASRPGGAG